MPDNIPTVNSMRLSHEAILLTISQIQPLTRSYLHAKPYLIDLRERLLAYFARQDKKFYTYLQRKHSHDRENLKMIEFLQHDLKDLKVQFLYFFEVHTAELGDQKGHNIIKDFRDFSGSVIARVKVEEDYLFPLF